MLTEKNYCGIVIIAKCENAQKGGGKMGFRKLRGAIREKYGTQELFAAAVCMHPSTLSSKLSGRTEWTRQEIVEVSALLGIPDNQIHEYFFAA